MIDAAFDHIVSDPEPAPKVEPETDPKQLWEEDWPEPSDADFGANPVYDTGT
ncbi:MAG: hypothetical protein AAGA08_00570 [Pseudomonadota bacterium]